VSRHEKVYARREWTFVEEVKWYGVPGKGPERLEPVKLSRRAICVSLALLLDNLVVAGERVDVDRTRTQRRPQR